MAVTAESGAGSADLAPRVDVRIAVENFGPIGKGEVDLRPLTVFVGASNTGKTFLSVLVYSLHNALFGFSRIPAVHRQLSRLLMFSTDGSTHSDEGRAAISAATKELIGKLRREDRPLRVSDLPRRLWEEAETALLGSGGAAEELVDELRRCFDLSSAASLIRARKGIDRAKVSVGAREGKRGLWGFDVTVSDSGIVVAGEIEDMVLVPAREPGSELGGRMERIVAHLEVGRLPQVLPELPHIVGVPNGWAHYLPAARSGIMQSHRMIASSVMKRATRAGLERASELPTLPGLLADFMQELIDHRGAEDGIRRTSRGWEAVEMSRTSWRTVRWAGRYSCNGGRGTLIQSFSTGRGTRQGAWGLARPPLW